MKDILLSMRSVIRIHQCCKCRLTEFEKNFEIGKLKNQSKTKNNPKQLRNNQKKQQIMQDRIAITATWAGLRFRSNKCVIEKRYSNYKVSSYQVSKPKKPTIISVSLSVYRSIKLRTRPST